jgi:integrase
MPRVNIVKQFKTESGQWVLRSIPRKPSGHYDWSNLPDGDYFIEWRESGRRKREPAGRIASQALEAQRRKRNELNARASGLIVEAGAKLVSIAPEAEGRRLESLIARYLDQIKTLKKPNTHRKYEAVLHRFLEPFRCRTLDSLTTDELNDFVVSLKKSGMAANTVLHNVIIIAQFCKRNGRSGLTRQLQLPERTSILPREYSEDELARFFAAADDRERELFTTFLFTGFREQEMVFLFWNDVNLRLRTIRVTSKPNLGFFPKRCEEREVPIPAHIAAMLQMRPRGASDRFVFPSPTGHHEQNMLLKCKAVAERAGLDPTKFDLKTFRSTYATRMLRAGFDVRTVQHWMGHKSLETTMRYLVPAPDVHDRLNRVVVPGRPTPRKGGSRQTRGTRGRARRTG